MENQTTGFEIEKKFLIAYPDLSLLEKTADRKLFLEQTYLLSEEGERARVRKITEEEKVTYIKTTKRKISAMRRIETEEIISAEAYYTELKKADPKRRKIEKTRYVISHENHRLEIDVFPFWSDKAFLEIELSDEAESFSIPSVFRVLRDVTEDSRYTNASLALSLPEE